MDFASSVLVLKNVNSVSELTGATPLVFVENTFFSAV
jgi:hypothetical protein